MTTPTPHQITLVRHGETKWSLSGQHTGHTDLPLLERGEMQAKALRKRLTSHHFSHIYTSPLRRASQTCELAGFCDQALVMEDLVEWDYGEYEGLTSEEIHEIDPHWTIFTKGAPGGESISDIAKRTERVLTTLSHLAGKGNILLFSSGHFLRALATRWLGLPLTEGKFFALSPGSLSILGWEKANPVLLTWNDTSHLEYE